jgi:hypothetical protein
MILILTTVFLILASLSAWAEIEAVSYVQMLEYNSENIQKVELGMTIDQVELLMKDYESEVRDGVLNNPWRTESRGNVKVYHYLVRKHPPFVTIRENQAMPVIFKDGEVVAIGAGYLEAARNEASQTAGPSTEETVEDRLIKLKSLYEKGLIDEESYEEQKTRILESI